MFPTEHKDALMANFKQAKAGCLLVAATAVHPLQLHQAFEGHLSQGLLVAEGGDQDQLV